MVMAFFASLFASNPKRKGLQYNRTRPIGGVFLRSRKEEVLEILTKNHNKFTAKELADELQIDRTNVSWYLNELTKEGMVQKIDGRPVKFQSTTVMVKKHIDFDNLIGRKDSLKSQIQKAKAAILLS